MGKHPDKPITTGLLGVDDLGSVDTSAGPPTELHTQPGFSDTWFDLESKAFRRA
jgi:peptide/nickel transport system ATP-binding protein/oligopeptide transport system ATP-binding protein